MPRPSNGRAPSTLAYSRPSWARSPSHRPCAKPPCASPLAAGTGCFLLPCSAPTWLPSWARKGPNHLVMLLASFHTHQQTSSNLACTASSTNTVSRDPILLPHYLLPSQAGSGLFSLLIVAHSCFPRFISIPQAGSGLFSQANKSVVRPPISIFQSLKREAASLAIVYAIPAPLASIISIPQAGSGLFSL